jgi:hypothetical protein
MPPQRAGIESAAAERIEVATKHGLTDRRGLEQPRA